MITNLYRIHRDGKTLWHCNGTNEANALRRYQKKTGDYEPAEVTKTFNDVYKKRTKTRWTPKNQ